jgi:iron complex transport system ATP-binding protein
MALLETSNLCFAYGDQGILRDLCFCLDRGELVALLGPNGSGKTTLIKTLLNLLPAQGEIAWAGKRLSQWPRRELARCVAYLPQAPTYDPGQTVFDTLRLGRSPYLKMMGLESARDAEVVRQVADSLSLTELLNTPLEHLSGGQRQRVFIGRCLAQEPQALLLDEPATYLDLRHQFELCRLLRELARERKLAILMASHDLNLSAAFADRMILLSEGAIVAQGAPSAVMEPELLTKVYGLPMKRLDSHLWVVPVIQ